MVAVPGRRQPAGSLDAAPEVRAHAPDRVAGMTDRPPDTRFATLAFCILLVVTIARISATYFVFSPTFDEPVHVAAGYDYLRQGTFLDVEHPPLAKAVFALPLVRSKPPRSEQWLARGNELLAAGGRYLSKTARARAGNLWFVLIALAAVALWGREVSGTVTGVTAAVLFAQLPVVLAHGGLATTDMPGTAAFATAMLAVERWLQKPSWRRTFGLAVAIAFGLVCKFSFAPYFAACATIAVATRRRLPLAKAALAGAAAFMVVFAVYLFSVGTMSAVLPDAPTMAKALALPPAAAALSLPAPAFFAGLLKVAYHDHTGHFSFLLGKFSVTGWWYYFPVALVVKTPIPFLILAVGGIVLAVRHRTKRRLALMAAAILGIAMTSHINLGVRHILPMFVPLSLLAADALRAMAANRRWAAAALSIWLLADGALAHPDYLPWMNALAGRHPERVLVDSNLDWGQDLVRLYHFCRPRRINNIGTRLFAGADLGDIGFTSWYEAQPDEPTTGWIAASESALQLAQAQNPADFVWLTRDRGFKRIGKTIRLYFIPHATSPVDLKRYEPVLFPLSYSGAGAYGSTWSTENVLQCGSDSPIVFRDPLDCAGCSSVLRGSAVLQPTSAIAGKLLFVERPGASHLICRSTIRHSSSSGVVSVAAPVVQGAEFRTGEFSFPMIATDPRNRVSVRIYAIEGLSGAKVILSKPNGAWTSELAVPMQRPAPHEAVFGAADLTDRLPPRRSGERIQIAVRPYDPAVHAWALLSITDEMTQRVTMLEPR